MQHMIGRSLLSLWDYTRDEIEYLVNLAVRLKSERRSGHRKRRLEGYTLAMIFEKRSTRTRAAFETAFGEEGGYPVFLSTDDIHLGVKEDLADTARVLGRMFDCIEFRGFRQETVEALARHSGVPVYNGLTDRYHPTQVLADLMTIQETRGSLAGRRLVYAGDGRNNVARSLMIGCAKTGVNYVVCAPEELQPEQETIDRCSEIAATNDATVTVTTDPVAGVAGADALYTDVWTSMGEEAESARRVSLLEAYRVTGELLGNTGRSDTIFLHCLPAVKGQEVAEDVFEGPASRVFDQAENRKHTIKAVILATLGKETE